MEAQLLRVREHALTAGDHRRLQQHLVVLDAGLAQRLDAWREALSASIPEEPSDE